MNVYDFDKTIFHYDSSVRFYLFELKRHPSICRYWPLQISSAVRHYLFKTIDKTTMKDGFYRYMSSINDIDEEIRLFWDQNMQYIHKWYLARKKDDDVIISASPVFLVKEACNRLGINNVLGSAVDKKTGRVLGPNCHDVQKVIVFHEAGYRDEQIDEFYSDSYSDDPLAQLARRSFLVKGETLLPWSSKK